jgi:hypothetical protein
MFNPAVKHVPNQKSIGVCPMAWQIKIRAITPIQIDKLSWLKYTYSQDNDYFGRMGDFMAVALCVLIFQQIVLCFSVLLSWKTANKSSKSLLDNPRLIARWEGLP